MNTARQKLINIQLTQPQAFAVFTLQRHSVAMAYDANTLRQMGSLSAAVKLEELIKENDEDTEDLIREYQTGLVRPEPGVLVSGK